MSDEEAYDADHLSIVWMMGSEDRRRHMQAEIDDLRARLEAAEAERDRLRDIIKLIRRDANEWCISRLTGNPHLENEKGEKMWETIRRASAMTAPIEGSAALAQKDEGDE